ncbi:putative nuclease HARBI1 isoform X1 [Harpegnathos saltator]|uniref:putative nuclease HARBI1 isoform X1 n=1 Tax=Harpegnathos saltator TaxID=610380 RepID=UPI000DBED9D2|nr:putative nuclease HARBI1 isoform X1 [Harpegnathos saltator]XP_025153589.1 putative nuclease HARBI1 isoform X1 [Harpegnathos saltator]
MAAQNRDILNEQTYVIISDFLSSSSSSDEDEYFLRNPRRIVPKMKNFLQIVHQYSNHDFKSHFRVSRATAYDIINNFENSTFYSGDTSHEGIKPSSAESHVLSFLWFAGNKVCLRDVAQRFGVCATTIFRQNKRMMDFLCDIAGNVIKFSDKENTANEFLQIAGFPKVLGCIDGTFIKVRTPAHKIKSTYVNRHDIPSITLQGICDARKRFIDTFTGIPSKIHDARVLKLSDICDELPGICEAGKYHILGDGAYPIREWLIIPFKDYGNLSAKDKQFKCCLRLEY